MITDTNIRKIPKYMLNLIQKKDKEFYPKPDGHTRFYTYYTKYNKELCSVTVAVRNKYKKWIVNKLLFTVFIAIKFGFKTSELLWDTMLLVGIEKN